MEEEDGLRANRTVALEWLVSLLVVDGLLRQGMMRILNTSISDDPSYWGLLAYERRPHFRTRLLNNKNPLQTPNTTDPVERSQVIYINDLSYRAGSVTDYLAIGLLLLHILMVLIHSACQVWRAQSSDSWESLTEPTTLLQHSEPNNGVLPNSSAGTQNLASYAVIGTVRAGHVIGDGDQAPSISNVEMVFTNTNMETSSREEDIDNKAWPSTMNGSQGNNHAPQRRVIYKKVKADELYGKC